MRLVRWTFVAVALALILGSDQDSSRAFRRPSPTIVAQSELDGTWKILSVHRDGQADPVQVGAYMTFANGEVKFWPKVPQFNFNELG
jgi:hypothetical protein